jgi:hypothetical protein
VIEMLFVLLFGAFVTEPFIDSGEGPNRCYLVDREMRQINGPCRWDETRGRTR